MRKTTLITFAALTLAAPALALDCEDGFRAFEHLKGETCIPTEPQRIVSLGSKNVTVPMIELGVLPVGSQGTLPDGGTPTIRASATATGVDFGNSDIAFVGDYPVDLELIAAQNPDLIIWPDWQSDVSLEQLEAIAPTVAYATDSTLHDAQAFYAALLERDAQLAANRARYDAQIAQLAALVSEGATYSIIHGGDGVFWTGQPYGNLDLILQDAGLTQNALIAEQPQGTYPEFSAERLQDLDADWIFTTYRTDRGQVPQDAIEAMEAAFPGFCDVLKACREGRLIAVPREEITTPSYDAVGGAIFMLTTVLSNPFIQPE